MKKITVKKLTSKLHERGTLCDLKHEHIIIIKKYIVIIITRALFCVHVPGLSYFKKRKLIFEYFIITLSLILLIQSGSQHLQLN